MCVAELIVSVLSVMKDTQFTVVSMQELHNRTAEKGELDLDDLEPGSMLEVSYLLQRLRLTRPFSLIILLSYFRDWRFSAICVR